MPYKTKRKTTKKKYPVKRTYKKYAKKNTINKSMVSLGKGFPKKVLMTHKYHATFPLSSTTGSLSTYYIVCNGMHDIDHTGTGHQPMYYDQLTALYDHYTVIGCKITVKVMGDSVSQGNSILAVFVNDDTTTSGTLIGDSIQENTTCKYRLLNAGNNSAVQTIKMNWSAKKYFGKSILGNPQFQGSSGSNPPEMSYFTIAYSGLNGATAIGLVDIMVEQIAIWTEMKDIGGS